MAIQDAPRTAQDLVNPHWWMPFTPNRDFLADPKLVTRAAGVHYTGFDGSRILDGASGLLSDLPVCFTRRVVLLVEATEISNHIN